ncbi:MAG: ORF6N domain-containing protein [Spirochaetia bacterium]|nr:ORF6N domain-containing protein [Spirochaetia bacterium]
MNDLINIKNKILVIRGQQVMLDHDLAELYGVETRVLNQAVRRNIDRFPEYFCFQLNKTEIKEVVTSCDHLKMLIFSPFNPYAFTEQGVAMLSAILRSKTAKKHMIESDVHQKISDQRIDTIFSLMDKYKIDDKQGIFYQGQIFDAFSQFQKLLQNAKKEIILIDNYIDLTVLDRLTKKHKGVKVTIYTKPDTPITRLEVNKFNNQYPTLEIKHTTTMHDRFLILDTTEIYHIGASLKDLGKKCFGFTKLDDSKRMIQAVLSWL